MATHLPRFSRIVGTQRRSGPCIDGFGACVSVVVLVATALAALVVRQNLDDHVYSAAASAAPAELTGAAVGSR